MRGGAPSADLVGATAPRAGFSVWGTSAASTVPHLGWPIRIPLLLSQSHSFRLFQQPGETLSFRRKSLSRIGRHGAGIRACSSGG
jgi:hypothetical protein